MKKVLLFLFLFTSFLQLNAQKTICGVPVGSPKDIAKEMLSNKYGNAMFEDYTSIIYADANLITEYSYAGFSWNDLYFSFEYDSKGNSFLDGALLTRYFKKDESEDAIAYFDTVMKELLGKNYLYNDNVSTGGEEKDGVLPLATCFGPHIALRLSYLAVIKAPNGIITDYHLKVSLLYGNYSFVEESL